MTRREEPRQPGLALEGLGGKSEGSLVATVTAVMPISRAEIPAKDAKGLIERLCQEWSSARTIDREETQARIQVVFTDRAPARTLTLREGA